MGALVKKGGTTALASWDAELAKFAEEAAAVEQVPSGNFISFKGGVLTVAGSPIKGNEADILVLDSVYENKMYEGKYDPENPQPPVCYAFSRTEEGLKPHDSVKSPKHETCAGCPFNEWGSAEQGKGKGCKNIRRLALISASNLENPDAVKNGEMFFAEVPVTSVKGWAGYVKGLAAALKRPPFGVITKLSVVPDTKSQFKVVFSDPRLIGAALGGAVMARVAEAKNAIVFPYPEAKEQTEEKPTKKRKF